MDAADIERLRALQAHNVREAKYWERRDPPFALECRRDADFYQRVLDALTKQGDA